MLSPMTSSSAAPPLPSSLVTFASVNVDVNKKAEKLDHNCQVHCQASQFQVSFQGLSFACSPCLCHNRPTNPCHVFKHWAACNTNQASTHKKLSPTDQEPFPTCSITVMPSQLRPLLPLQPDANDCLTAVASKQRSCRRRERAKRVAGRAYWHTGILVHWYMSIVAYWYTEWYMGRAF